MNPAAPATPPAHEAREPRLASLVSRQPAVIAAHRRSSLWMGALGVLGVALAPLYVWRFGFGLLETALFLGMYWLTLGVGLSVGFHRHFTHGSFRAGRALRWAMAALGSMGAQGPLTYWVSIHRRHHEFGDVEGDPHSPHLSGGTASGLWHAHYGWSLSYGVPNATHYCPDLLRDPALMAIQRHYRAWVAAGLLLPASIGWAVTGSWQGALAGVLWGGLVRIFVSSNMTWSLNSFCHRFGARAFATDDHSTNNAWLALPTLGESWHNNHHAHPTSAAHGLRWWQVDLNYAFIWLLEKLGLASDVKRPAERSGAARA